MWIKYANKMFLFGWLSVVPNYKYFFLVFVTDNKTSENVSETANITQCWNYIKKMVSILFFGFIY